jgi:membrane-associated phospholipid phosphatase
MDAAVSPLSAAEWAKGLLRRGLCYTPVKFVGISGVMSGFFIAYFWLLNHPRSAPHAVPLIFLDHWVPFWPWALPLYLTLWLYVIIPPVLLRTPREMVSYTVSVVVLSLAGFLVFYFLPTAVPALVVDPGAMPELARLKVVDATGNAFPSLHVAFAVFSALWLRRQLREQGTPGWILAANWAWCAAIVYSTLAIRQHVALDAVSGAVLGGVVAWLQQALLDRRGGG